MQEGTNCALESQKKIADVHFLRKPFHLEELNQFEHGIAIWRSKETLTYVTPHGSDDFPSRDQRCLSLYYNDKGVILRITGKNDDDVVKTAEYFMRLEQPTPESSSLLIGFGGSFGYDFRDVDPMVLMNIFDVAPSRELKLQNLTLSIYQAAALTLIRQPTKLSLCECRFEDDGKLFLIALEERRTKFGSLTLDFMPTLNDDKLQRLLQLDTLEHLGLHKLSDALSLLPFSAKVDSLAYEIFTKSFMKADFRSLNIVPNKLDLCIEHDEIKCPIESICAFLKRIADLGHLTKLKIRFLFHEEDDDVPECVVRELTRARLANYNLEELDLTTWQYDLVWDPHLATLFEGLKGHKGLRTLTLSVEDSAFGPQYSLLRKFLSLTEVLK